MPKGFPVSGLISVFQDNPQPLNITKLEPGGTAFGVTLNTLEPGKTVFGQFFGERHFASRRLSPDREINDGQQRDAGTEF